MPTYKYNVVIERMSIGIEETNFQSKSMKLPKNRKFIFSIF